MTLQRNTEFMHKMRKDNRNLLEVESQEINFGYFRKNLDMLMMGIEGNIFLLDHEKGAFLLNNSGLSLSDLSRSFNLIKERTLNSYLSGFLRPATKLFRLKQLKEHLNCISLNGHVTYQEMLRTLSDYLNFVNKALLDIPESYTLLEYGHELSNLVKEVDLMYKIFYWKGSYTRDLKTGFKMATETENLDHLYRVSTYLYHSMDSSNIIRSIMQDTLYMITRHIHEILFIDPKHDKLINALKIVVRKDKDYDFIIENAPLVLKKCLNDLLTAVQYLSLLQRHEPLIYAIIISWNSDVSLKFSGEEIKHHKQAALRNYRKAEKMIEDVFIQMEIDSQQRELARISKRLERLKDIKSVGTSKEESRQGKNRTRAAEANRDLQTVPAAERPSQPDA